MLRNAIFALTAAAGLGVALVSSASAAGLGAGLGALAAAAGEASARPVSFWGEPYPYGYRPRHSRCYQPARVETPYGWRWELVWVCHR